MQAPPQLYTAKVAKEISNKGSATSRSSLLSTPSRKLALSIRSFEALLMSSGPQESSHKKCHRDQMLLAYFWRHEGIENIL